MSGKLKCEVVRDLLPLYVEKLTSEVTSHEIESHIEHCIGCKEALDCMQEPEVIKEAETKKEVNHLKKWRRKSATMSLFVAMAMCLLSIVLIVWKQYFIGNHTGWGSVACEVSVNGNKVTVNANMLDSYSGVAKIGFEESEGVVTVRIHSAPKTFFNHSEFSKTYETKKQITKVCLDDYILWENGTPIGHFASTLFHDKNPYIGNISADGTIARHLEIGSQFGSYKTELQTKKKPYGWKLIFEEPVAKEEEENAKKRMRQDSVIMLATIENMGYITWDYEIEGKRKTYTLTEQDATTFAAGNIKAFAKSAAELQKLLFKCNFPKAGTKEELQSGNLVVTE